MWRTFLLSAQLTATSATWTFVFFSLPGCNHDPALPGATGPSVAPRAPTVEIAQLARDFGPASVRATVAPADDGVCSRFADIAASAGIEHSYLNGSAGSLLMVEATGGGCGWLDYDRDGLWDLYLPQGGHPDRPPSPSQPRDQLFRNQGSGTFEDVTEVCGIDERGYSQGVAIGDLDNDGFDDIYVTNVGPNVLFKNCGDGTFQDMTDAAGVAGDGWSSSAAWGDIDRDGDLDLYVCRYVNFDRFHPQICRNPRGLHVMCQPNQVAPTPDECYLNLGDGRFEPVARERGLSGPGNRALGVAIADFDNDGWPDIFVANDATANFLFINQRNGRFAESAMLLGCALPLDGAAQANMGIAVGDYDRNGFLDLYVTHFEGEWNTLYKNLGPGGFHDVTGVSGLVRPTLPWVGWGTVMADFNQDGYDELFVANGHLNDIGREFVLEQPPQLFACAAARWRDCSAEAGEYFERKLVGRGAAEGDFDNDGDWDLAVAHQGKPTALLQNESDRGDWLKIELVGRRSNRRGVGTRIVVRSGSREIMQEMAGGLSYCSSRQSALIFGLGSEKGPCDVRLAWPSGVIQELRDVVADQALTIIEPIEDR